MDGNLATWCWATAPWRSTLVPTTRAPSWAATPTALAARSSPSTARPTPLAKNDGNNTLHGGPGGYHQVLWDAQAQDGEEPSITFTHTSPDGDEGYPGTLQMTVTYTLKKDNTLALRNDAVCDQETPFNPTNHSFFNLSGDPQKDVLGTTSPSIPRLPPLCPMTSSPPARLSPLWAAPWISPPPRSWATTCSPRTTSSSSTAALTTTSCVEGEGFRKHAEAYEPESGRVMEVWVRPARRAAVHLQQARRRPGGQGWQAYAAHTPPCA